MKASALKAGGNRVGPVAAVAGFASCLTAYVARFGYDFGNSDQDELVPAVYRVLSDNLLFVNDWFVSYQTEVFNVRSVAILLTSELARIVTPFHAVLILYVCSAAATYAAVYALASRLTASRLLPWLCALTVFVLTKGFTLGGNDVIHGMYVPSMTAWAFALWAIVFWLRDSSIVAGLLAGLAVPIQALVGIHCLLLIVLAGGLLSIGDSIQKWVRRSSLFVASFAVVAVGPIYFLLLSQSAILPTDPPVDSFLDILATIRAPHHFLPRAFPSRSIILFGSLATIGMASIFSDKRRPDRRQYLALLAAIGIYCTASLAFTELLPVTTVVKLQLFKLTVFAKVLLVISVAYGATRLATAVLPVYWTRTIDSFALFAIMAAVCVGSVIVFWFRPPLAFTERSRSDWGRVESWIAENTSDESVFMIPPSVSHFRSATRRAIFVNYKATPFDDANLQEWLRRMKDQTGLVEIPAGVSAVQLDSAYRSLPRSAVLGVADANDIDYVVMDVRQDSAVAAFQSGSLFVYPTESLRIK